MRPTLAGRTLPVSRIYSAFKHLRMKSISEPIRIRIWGVKLLFKAEARLTGHRQPASSEWRQRRGG